MTLGQFIWVVIIALCLRHCVGVVYQFHAVRVKGPFDMTLKVVYMWLYGAGSLFFAFILWRII